MLRRITNNSLRLCAVRSSARLFSSSPNAPSEDEAQPPIPEYQARSGEPTDVKRARILYQCRKRGMLENGILLSCFADQYLADMTETQLNSFDLLINKPSNDWDIYHWITGKEPTPVRYESEILTMLKEFVRNKDMEVRIRQPDLYKE